MRILPPLEAKERRLAGLLAEQGRKPGPALAEIVADAQLLGSLELAGFGFGWEEVRRSRASGLIPPEISALRRASESLPLGAPLGLDAIRAWHATIAGPAGWRRQPRERPEAPASPPELIESRMETLQEWLSSAGMQELAPERRAGLVHARILEILPFDDANGRVARLAASHLMVSGGLRPPILVGADGPYLLACLRAAFRLDTEPLVSLLLEASGRAVDVMIQTLDRGEAQV